MASTHKHIRSSTANKRPTTAIADGQIALNTNSTSPGLFFKDSTGATIIKVGPVHIGATAPNATPPSGGSSGNSTGEIWLDTSLTPNGVKIWDGSAWVNATPIGSTTVQGLLELATNAETQTGSDTARAVTPAGLQSKMSDSTSTTSSTTIASSTAVKAAYDLAAAALPLSGGTVTGNLEIGTTGSLSFEGATANTFETTIAVVDPTADRTITLPDTTGTVVTTGDTGTVTSTMIADGTIVNGDINASAAIAYSKLNLATSIVDGDISATAEIAVSKLADGTARQLLQTDAAGTGVEWASNIDIPGTLDVTSAATFDSSATIVGDLTVDTNTLKVDSTNNRVGIGVSSPGVLLELGTATPILRFSDTDTTGYHQIQSSNANFIINADPSNADANSSISFNVDGSERARVDSSGRLLVGTSSSTSANIALVQGATSGSAGQFGIARNNNTPGTADALANVNFITSLHETVAQIQAARDGGTWTASTSYPTSLQFSTTANGASSPTERMRIDSSGRVGIGTASPAAALHVSALDGTVYQQATRGTGTTWRLQTSGANGQAYELYDITNSQRAYLYTGGTGGSWQFSTEGTERLRIDSSGRVGIGTTSPTVPLAVAKDGTTGPTGITGTSTTASFANTAANRGIGINYDDTNVTAGIFSLGTNSQLCFYTPTTATYAERMRIDSSGRLLVGTTTSIPVGAATASNVQIAGDTSFQSLSRWANNGNGPALVLGKSRSATVGTYSIVSSGDTLGQLVFAGDDGTDIQTVAATIKAEVDGTPGANDMPGRLVFSTTVDGASSVTERMRISSTGNILFGTTGVPNGTSIYGAAFENTSNDRQILKTATSVTTSGSLVAFYNPNGLVGTISVSGSATAYNTSSDYRLKENITPLTDATVRVQQLKPSRFNFIADPDTEVDGFIAHEVQEIVPEAITGIKDEVDEDGKPLYQGIDQSKLVPLLTAALQEALDEIESLKARLTAAGI